MTRAELRARVQRAINDSGGIFLPDATANAVLEEAQEILAEHGSPVIRRVGIPLRAYWTYYRLSTFAPDAMAPVRLYHSGTNRVLDVTSPDELDRQHVTWATTTGDPQAWFPRGFDRFGLYPMPASAGTILWVDALCWPQTLLHDAASPEFRAEDQEALYLYGVYDALLRALQVADAVKFWQRFVASLGPGAARRGLGTPDRTAQHGASQ